MVKDYQSNTGQKAGGAADTADNITAFSSQADIKQQAGEWLVRMDQGPLTSEEAASLQAWAGRSDFHQQYLLKLAKNWDAMGVLEELSVLFPLPAKVYDRAIAGDKHRSTGWSLAGALRSLWQQPRFEHWRWPAVAGTAMGPLVLVLWLFGLGSQQTFITQVGEQQSYQLSDGTTLMLNTDTALTVDYSGDNRVLRLTRGEAHFTVAKNPARPFLVYAGEGLVWAVGTAFNVRLDVDSVDVTVTEGRVKVFAEAIAETPPALKLDLNTEPVTSVVNASAPTPATETLLAAGEVAQYKQKVVQVLSPVMESRLQQKLAWQTGALVFDGETLEQALTEIARYTQQDLVIKDDAIRHIRIGGHYKADDVDGLLLALGDSFGVAVKRIGNDRVHLFAK